MLRMNQESSHDAASPPEARPAINHPAVTFSTVTFSDGTTITLQSNDIVVIVGPNNAGKSVALRDLETAMRESYTGAVVTNSTLSRSGTLDELREFLKSHSQVRPSGRTITYAGYRFSCQERRLQERWSGDLSDLAAVFCMRLSTETRITDSNPAPAIPVLDQPASHPIHMLYSDDDLEHRIGEYFRQAFGEDLIVFRAGGAQFPLFAGARPDLIGDEDRASVSYLRRLRESNVALQEQGDGMRSFASVVLHLLAPVTPSVLLLDEPEAFLHPPQARLLGELMATKKRARSQLFVATHSLDVLNGLLNVAPEHLRVLRIRRDGDVNRVKELDKERAKAISGDPLMKYSSVMSGVFHQRVIICESEADCMFYQSVLDLPEVHGVQQPDVHFVHGSGKYRMAGLVQALAELDVIVDVIVDLDVMNQDDVLRCLVTSLGMRWDDIADRVQAIRTAIEEKKPWLQAEEVKRQISGVLESVEDDGEFPNQAKKQIEHIFRKASPWDAIKEAGEAAIPKGEATKHYLYLRDLFKEHGLWIVQVGELEGFCRAVGGHGPNWVQGVMEARDIATDEGLEAARQFVGEMWRSRGSG